MTRAYGRQDAKMGQREPLPEWTILWWNLWNIFVAIIYDPFLMHTEHHLSGEAKPNAVRIRGYSTCIRLHRGRQGARAIRC
jgi:hypothetical protein